MILQKTYPIKITNRNRTEFSKRGYTVKAGFALVDIENLSAKVPIKCSCDICGSFYTVTKSKLNDVNLQFCQIHRWDVYSVKRKEYWGHPDQAKTIADRAVKISANRKGKGLKPPSHWLNKRKYHKYCMDVKRHQYQFRNQISNLPGYSNIGRCGVYGATQIDHIISKRYGFENDVPPEKIGHICNIQIISWEKNLEKSSSNGFSLEYLDELIEKYHRKQ